MTIMPQGKNTALPACRWFEGMTVRALGNLRKLKNWRWAGQKTFMFFADLSNLF